MTPTSRSKHCLKFWVLLMALLLYCRSLFMFKERNGPRSGGNVRIFKVVKCGHLDLDYSKNLKGSAMYNTR